MTLGDSLTTLRRHRVPLPAGDDATTFRSFAGYPVPVIDDDSAVPSVEDSPDLKSLSFNGRRSTHHVSWHAAPLVDRLRAFVHRRTYPHRHQHRRRTRHARGNPVAVCQHWGLRH